MLHISQNNSKIKHLNERYLRRVQSGKLPSYEELLEKYVLVVVHHRNIQSLTRQVVQIKNGQSCEIATNIFTQTTEECNFRQNRDLRTPTVSTEYNGSESTSI